MDAGTLRGIFTLIMLVLFVAICIWAFSTRRKGDFEAQGRVPLEPDELEDLDAGTRSRNRLTESK